MRIDIHVQRLLLDGIGAEPGHAPRIARALERELARLFASSDAPFTGSGAAVPRLTAPDIHRTSGESPEAVGVRIAVAVHGEIGRGTR